MRLRFRQWALCGTLLGGCGAAIAACSSFEESATGSGVDAAPTDDAPEAGADVVAPSCDLTTTSTDPNNCGRCGHDCLGGGCAAGLCQPVLLGSSTDAPVLTMAVDTSHVIWMTATVSGGGEGSLYLCPKTGCSGPPTTLATNRGTGALAGNGGVAYASFTYATNEIVRIEGTSIVSIPSISYHEVALNLAMRGSTLYINAFYEGDGGQPRSIFAFDEPAKETLLGVFPGGTVGSLINTLPFTVSDKAIFLGANNIGRIVKCEIPGCTTWTDFLDGETAYANTLTTDDKRLFWSGGVSGYLSSCPVEGATCAGTKTELGPAVLGTGKAIFAKIDRGTLFITTSDGRILTCDPGSCTATVREIGREAKLAASYPLFGPPFAADALAFYYAAVDETDGAVPVSRIMKLAR